MFTRSLIVVSFLLMACAADRKTSATSASATNADLWGVYAEKMNEGKALSCWVCPRSSIGNGCIGNVLIPDTEWETRKQAEASACVLKNNGKCLVVQNATCP